MAPPTRREKEVLIAGVTGQSLKGKTATEVASKLGGSEGMRGVRKMPNGMYAVSFANAAAKAAWVKDGKEAALERLGASAHIKVHSVDVIACGFPGGTVSRMDEGQRIRAVKAAAPGAGEGLVKAVVMRSSPYRSTEAMILGYETPELANRAIDQGITWGNCVLNAEPFARGVRAERCYKCQQYGHTARFCRAARKCAWCAENHDLMDCPVKGQGKAKTCAACKGDRSHCALDGGCPTKLAAEARAKGVYNGRPTRFRVQATASAVARETEARGASPPGGMSAVPTAEPSVAPDTEPSSERERGYEIVGSKRKKVPRGRPSGLAVAARNTVPIDRYVTRVMVDGQDDVVMESDPEPEPNRSTAVTLSTLL